MARTRKSRPHGKAVRATAAPKKRASRSGVRKPADRKAAKPKSAKAPAAEPAIDSLDGFIAAAARVLALPVEPQWHPSIKANLEVNLRLAALVAAFVLPDEAEPAPVFTA